VNIALPNSSHLDLFSIFRLVASVYKTVFTLLIVFGSIDLCDIVCSPSGYHMIPVTAPIAFPAESQNVNDLGEATPRLLPIPPLWAHRQLRVTPAKCLGIHVLHVVHGLETAN
jgi:hypothetical protein